jgi:hypothetical protein
MVISYQTSKIFKLTVISSIFFYYTIIKIKIMINKIRRKVVNERFILLLKEDAL